MTEPLVGGVHGSRSMFISVVLPEPDGADDGEPFAFAGTVRLQVVDGTQVAVDLRDVVEFK